MVVLIMILAISSLLVGYLIWSGGGFVQPTQSDKLVVVTALPGYDVRLAQLSDVPAFLEIAGEPEAMQAQGWDQAALDSAADTWGTMLLSELQRSFIVAESDAGEVAGFTSLANRAGDPDQISIGLHIRQAHSGHGVGTTLMRAVIVYLQVSECEAWVGTATTNVAVQKIMERLGFSPEPEIEPYEAPNGECFDSLWYKVGVGTRVPRA